MNITWNSFDRRSPDPGRPVGWAPPTVFGLGTVGDAHPTGIGMRAAWTSGRRAFLLIALSAVTGCATLGEKGQSLVPTSFKTRTGPYAVYTNFPIEPDDPAIRSLQSLERDIETTLGIHVNAEEPPVEVYILNDRQAFSHFMMIHYPELPPRRAFFLAKGPQRIVYTFKGERLEEDLRHEATHALLNVAVGDMPLWLDEGLAEYFEGPDNRRGMNAEHLNRLPKDRAAGWKPDLARLESIASVRDMAPRDYRESWAWVHYLLNDSNPNKALLLGYLADLRSAPGAKPLSQRIAVEGKDSGQVMLTHLDRVRSQPLAVLPTSADSTIRFQDMPVEPAKTAAPRPGFFGRIGRFFGF